MNFNVYITSIQKNSKQTDINIIIDSKIETDYDVKFYLNDFDKILLGHIIDEEEMDCEKHFVIRFKTTKRFNEFEDGILKILISEDSIESGEYFCLIYSCNWFESLHYGNISRVEKYFDGLYLDDCDYYISKKIIKHFENESVYLERDEYFDFEDDKFSEEEIDIPEDFEIDELLAGFDEDF